MEDILQIASATGWSAVFVHRNEDSGGAELETWPLAVWALVQKGEDTYITGYLGVDYCAAPCSDDPHFVGFLAEGEDAEERFLEEAVEQLQEQEKASA
jgi:hypothetical protein